MYLIKIFESIIIITIICVISIFKNWFHLCVSFLFFSSPNLERSSGCICVVQVSIWRRYRSPPATINQSHRMDHRGSSWTWWCLLAFLFLVVHPQMAIEADCYSFMYYSYHRIPSSCFCCARSYQPKSVARLVSLPQMHFDHVSNHNQCCMLLFYVLIFLKGGDS